MLGIGDTVKVQIIRINKDTQRISLGMKQLESDPWEGAAAKYPVGGMFRGRVTNITEYGAFVELEPGIEGLVHVSEMSWTKKNVHPGKIVSTSQEVDVKVLEVDEEKRRISLGLKQAQANPWEAFAAAHPVGSVVEGEVKNATEFGLFVGLEGDVDGMVHMSDIAWGVSGEEALQLHRKGETVKAQVLDVDVEKERISLGMKQLEGGGTVPQPARRRPRGAAAGGVRRARPSPSSSARSRTPVSTSRSATTARSASSSAATLAATATSSVRALPGRSASRRDGHRLRPFEEAELLDQGDADRRGEAGRRAIRSSDSGASLGDILGQALKEAQATKAKKKISQKWRRFLTGRRLANPACVGPFPDSLTPQSAPWGSRGRSILMRGCR